MNIDLIGNNIINGKLTAEKLNQQTKNAVELFTKEYFQPGLAVILVGNNPASLLYINNKAKLAKQVGIYSEIHHLDENISEQELIKHIKALNENPKISGIIVQLPLPEHLDAHKVIETISPSKDVDGFHPENVGKLNIGIPGLMPCTPLGVHYLLTHITNLKGKNIAIIGRSNIVGKPLAAILNQENATVTLCHSHTKNLDKICQNSDIVITATGQSQMFDMQYFNNNSIVIDVGISLIQENDIDKLVGDVNFAKVQPHVKLITPVPKGIGPLTVAFLMKNTLLAARYSLAK